MSLLLAIAATIAVDNRENLQELLPLIITPEMIELLNNLITPEEEILLPPLPLPPEPAPDPGCTLYKEEAHASWYGPGFQGNLMANQKVFNEYDPTVVAHKTLPLGSSLLLEYGGVIIEAVVQDRGPYIDGREIDLSRGAMLALAGEEGINIGVVTPNIYICK